MKKVLLGTTALMSAAALAGAAHAAGPTVTVGGFIDFQAGFADQDSAFATGGFSREQHIVTDTEIHVNVEGQADNGIVYGAVIELNADTDGDADGDGGNADKAYIYLESEAGRVEMGNNVSVVHSMKVDASTIARATGGIDGDFYRHVDVATGGPFLISPDLPSQFTTAVREDATKVSYFTPSFSGLQVGVSFTPDEGDTGTASGLSSDTGTNQENVVGVGVKYSGEVEGVGIHASATGEFGSAETATTEDVAAWALGLGADFEGFSVAGSWADWGESGLSTTAAPNDDQSFWTLGAAYENGPYGISVTYLQSEATQAAGTDEHEFSNLVVGADYQLAPGLVPYVEVSFFDTDDNVAASADNDGSVVLVGAELTF